MVSANLAMSDHTIPCEVAWIGRPQGPNTSGFLIKLVHAPSACNLYR
jgi:hypothetical protein